jgi:hypothetical protein
MTEIIDLSLLKDSQIVLDEMLKRRGLAYFMAREGRPLSLESTRVELVVKSCVKKLERKGRPVHPRALDHCRRLVRRELIRRVTATMMGLGY